MTKSWYQAHIWTLGYLAVVAMLELILLLLAVL